MDRKKWTEVAWTAERRALLTSADEAICNQLRAYHDGAEIRFAHHDNHQWRVGRVELHTVFRDGARVDGRLISFGHDQFFVFGGCCFEEDV